MAHSRFGGSKAAQFIICTASPQLSSLVAPEVDQDDPDYRRDGIAAHAVAAECLQTGVDAWELMGDPRWPFFREASQANSVQLYVDLVRERSLGEFRVEQMVANPDDPEHMGTLDATWTENDVRVVCDYKNGAGIAVDVEDNAQLLYYAGLLLRVEPTIEAFELLIVQPRAWHANGPVRSWPVSAVDVRRWEANVLLPAIAKGRSSGAEFVPGSHCRWCPAKLACPVLKGMARAVAEVTTIGQVVDPKMLTDAELDAEYALLKPAEMYFTAVAVEAQRRAMAGVKFYSAKVVKKKSDRAWLDPAAAQDAALKLFGKDAVVPISLKGPAGIAKLKGGPEFVAAHAFSPETGYTLAPTADKRKEVVPTTIPQCVIDNANAE